MTPEKWPETAAFGIFWTLGRWDNLEWYDYLTNQRPDHLSLNTLKDLSRDRNENAERGPLDDIIQARLTLYSTFHVRF